MVEKTKKVSPLRKGVGSGKMSRTSPPLVIQPKELVAATINEAEGQLQAVVARLQDKAGQVWWTLQDALQPPRPPGTGQKIDLPTAKAIAEAMIQMSLVSRREVDGEYSEGWKVGTWLWADKLTCQAVVSCLRLAIVETLCGIEFLDRDVNLTPGK